uniref:Cwf19-like C-terminal domain-containing protein n=2 Tax=Clastoptera arizonana TaxID=38151 RepID=A0A1B6E6F5_9HEMI
MADKQKILICGDVNGKFKHLFSRVANINKKSGPFDFLLCVGNFFGTSDNDWLPYKNGSISVPVPTYVLGPNNDKQVHFYPDINGCEIAPNISYLGKRGVFSSSTGLKIAYLSGVEGKESTDFSFTAKDVTKVRDLCTKGQPSYLGIDFLLTSAWPKEICRLDSKSQVEPVSSSSALLSWLAVQIKPRYYFCALESIYYERSPYKNLDNGNGIHCTRFIALSSVDNPKKHKWLYALNVTSMDVMRRTELFQQTTDQTDLPYSGVALSGTCGNVSLENPTQFFYDMTPVKRKNDDDQGKGKRQRPSFDQGKCWFCLASPQVEKHMVISIGTEVYLALAKGGLVPHHVLILPITHHQAVSQIPESILVEIEKFKKALTKCFAKDGKVPVFFERNYKTSHLQIQVVPVPQNLSVNLKMKFEDFAEAEGVNLDELPENTRLDQIAPPGTPYFYLELPSKEILYHRVRKNFPLQFAREVLASSSVLNVEERVDWKDCTVSKEEETALTQKFRKYFEPFDFTL